MRKLADGCFFKDGKLEMPQSHRGMQGFSWNLIREKTQTKLDGLYTVRGAHPCRWKIMVADVSVVGVSAMVRVRSRPCRCLTCGSKHRLHVFYDLRLNFCLGHWHLLLTFTRTHSCDIGIPDSCN